ncbi:alpha/beta fold hydrolase [Acidicapsa acidisoli]|uniref:alpha/beta fold hydrolase n=1 Tax=Acidicapsa acidisoli TaxID=1615681 RepID=UPI0021E02E5D|nr:alpha/beta hydrolase [Acidicapsa acidisoli]
MSFVLELSCWVYKRMLPLYTDNLRYRYGDEMEQLFREQLLDAGKEGVSGIGRVWQSAIGETISLVAPSCVAAFSLWSAATVLSCSLILLTSFGFCTFGNAGVVYGCTKEPGPQTTQQSSSVPGGHLVSISQGHKMFIECTGESHGRPTVILATGRGLGSYQDWSLVQSRVSEFARVCSYDPLGFGESDHIQGDHSISEVVENMHDLFQSAQLPGPYLLVGASAGGVLIRHYEEQYPADVTGFVFVDSSHEEAVWRDAAISPAFPGSDMDMESLQREGLLPPQQHLTWHDDVPMIVLERGERAPCSAFPGLTQTQCDQINEAWHSFQVDLSHRSKYAQLRIIAGAGHRMHQEKPEAISQAIHDVLEEVKKQKP